MFSLLHVLCVINLDAQDNVWLKMPCNDCGGARFHDVEFATPDSGFVASSLILYRTIDGGRSWTKLERDDLTRSGIGAISFINGHTGYAGGKELLKTTDSGESWISLKDVSGEYTGRHISRLQFISSGFGVAVGDGSLVVYTRDGGLTWRLGSSGCGTCRSVSIASDTVAYIAGTTQAQQVEAIVERQRKSGQLWSPIPEFISAGRLLLQSAMTTLGVGRIWVGGNRLQQQSRFNQHLVFSSDTGKTWNQPSTVLPAPVTAIAFVDSLMGFVGDEQGDIYRTADGGFTWAREYKGNAEQPIKDIAIKGKTIVAVGDYSLILRRSELVSVAEDVPTNLPTLRLYPNPTTGVVMVESDLGPAQFIVVDVLGTVVMQLPAESKTTIDLSAFPPGMYRVMAQTSSAVRSETVAVVR